MFEQGRILHEKPSRGLPGKSGDVCGKLLGRANLATFYGQYIRVEAAAQYLVRYTKLEPLFSP